MSYKENLYTFIRMYQLGSQQKAANELNLTQPAISQHIKILEHYIGKPLFYKKGRSLAPTLIAHQLALAVSESFNKLDEALHNLNRSKEVIKGTIYIGGITEFFTKVIIPSLKPIFKHNIQIRFEEDHHTLLPRLLSGEFDLAQFTTHIVHPNVVIEKIFQQEFILVGHREFKKHISIKQLNKSNTACLQNLPWIAYDESLLFINEYFQTAFKTEFNSNVKLIVKDLWAILQAVNNKLGVSVLPSYFCNQSISSGKLCVLYKPKRIPHHSFYLGWKRGALEEPKIKLIKKLIEKAGSNSI